MVNSILNSIQNSNLNLNNDTRIVILRQPDSTHKNKKHRHSIHSHTFAIGRLRKDQTLIDNDSLEVLLEGDGVSPIESLAASVLGSIIFLMEITLVMPQQSN